MPAILDGYFADPNLVVFGNRYYLYPTTDGSDQWRATSFRAFSSTDLVAWEDHGEVFSLEQDTRWAKAHAWAPAATERRGLYYLYYTAEQENIGVATASSPTGPFIDLGRPLVAEGDFTGRAIDPSVFTDNDGTPYLLWGNTVAHIVPLNPDMVSFEAAKVVSWVPTAFCEAIWLHRRDDTYYLSWSQNDTRDENYRVYYATSSSPLGPWTDRGVLLEKIPERGILATGHHSIVRVPNTDDWLIAYHRFAIPDGSGYRRELAIDRLRYTSDGLLHKVDPARAPLTQDLAFTQPEQAAQ
ncbi:MAG: family 43 glycosylhydrolase [Actinomycetales bacterium]